MAVENHGTNPIIIEPAASSSPDTPPKHHLTPSLHPSSSSTSFDSSRPQSRGSSATTPSVSSSPVPKSAYSHEFSGLSPPSPLNLDPPVPDATSPTTYVPPEPAEGSSHSNGAAWRFLRCPSSTRRRWLEHALGVLTLVATLVGLLFVGVRTYKLAVISTENSTLDGCTGLIQVSEINRSFDLILTSNQAGFATVENSTQLCKTAMKNGPLSSPYHLYKRILQSPLAQTPRWMTGLLERTCGFPYSGCQTHEADITYRNTLALAIVINATLALGGLMLIVARRNARSMEVFTSPARSDIHIIHRDDSGPRSVAGQGVIEVQNPQDNQDLDPLRKRLRASQDQNSLMKDTAPLQATNSSSTTLVDGYNNSQVSLQNRSSGEKNEGLVELQMNGSTRAFYKIDTGEFLHVKHWKRQRDDDSGSSSDSQNPVSIEEECFTQDGPVASALAKGKAARDKCIGHATQQAGDCLAGWITNEYPTGKPQLI